MPPGLPVRSAPECADGRFPTLPRQTLCDVQDFARDSGLVTGATGFVGAELLRVLFASGVAASQLRCLVRDADRAVRGGVPPECVRRGDVTDAASLRAAAADVGLVFHLAGTLKGSRAS